MNMMRIYEANTLHENQKEILAHPPPPPGGSYVTSLFPALLARNNPLKSLCFLVLFIFLFLVLFSLSSWHFWLSLVLVFLMGSIHKLLIDQKIFVFCRENAQWWRISKTSRRVTKFISIDIAAME